MTKPLSDFESLKAEASQIGFEAISWVNLPATWPAEQGLNAYIAASHHGQMKWMETTRERRSHPQNMWAEAKSAIILGTNYGPSINPLEILDHADLAAISCYAQNKDYHDLIKKRLKRLARWLAETHEIEVKVFVDTAPLMEKPLAQLAGLGWQGKHTNLVSKTYGSWLFLGVILTDSLIDEPHLEETDHCGSCTACLDICPTKAFPAPYKLDARKCISYLTIEYEGPIPREYRKLMGNRIYGCDDCLAICPWNKFAQSTSEMAFLPREELKAPTLRKLVQLDEAGFREMFRGSPIKRIRRARFIRNVLIAIGNSGDASLKPYCLKLMNDDEHQISEAAEWALNELNEKAV